mgnify:CR=1 FL=1
MQTTKKITGYAGSTTNPDSVLQKLLDLGGHNILHIKCNNPNKLYYLLPNKTISCKWLTDDSVCCTVAHTPFNMYITNGIAFCAYNYDDTTVWNPGMGFIHIPDNSSIEKLPASKENVRDLLMLANHFGYVYSPRADVWRFKITMKSPCYYKESMMDMFWNIGVFLGYDDNGNAVVDRGSDSTLVCRAAHCVPYSSFASKVDVTGQINDKLVNKHLI